MFLQSSSVPGLSCDLLYIVVNLVPRVCLFAGYVPLHNPRTGILWERDCIVVKTSRQTSKPIDHSYFNRWFGDSMKVQYNLLTMLLSSFMQEFGPISSRVYCIFAQITNNKFVVELSIRNLNKCSI